MHKRSFVAASGLLATMRHVGTNPAGDRTRGAVNGFSVAMAFSPRLDFSPEGR